MVLLSETLILKVIPNWYYVQNQWFWKWYQNGISFRISDSESNAKMVLLSESMILTDSESNTKMVLLSESLILKVIPKWYYFQNQSDSESNTKTVLLSE